MVEIIDFEQGKKDVEQRAKEAAEKEQEENKSAGTLEEKNIARMLFIALVNAGSNPSLLTMFAGEVAQQAVAFAVEKGLVEVTEEGKKSGLTLRETPSPSNDNNPKTED